MIQQFILTQPHLFRLIYVLNINLYLNFNISTVYSILINLS